MPAFLLDTNHLGAALSRTSRLRERLWQARHAGHRFGTCVPVLAELEAGIQQTPDPEANRQALTRLLSQVRTWPLDRSTAKAYGTVYQELRRAGVVISQVDMLLAALARTMGLILLTTDSDFRHVAGLRIENWVAP